MIFRFLKRWFGSKTAISIRPSGNLEIRPDHVLVALRSPENPEPIELWFYFGPAKDNKALGVVLTPEMVSDIFEFQKKSKPKSEA